MSSVLPYLLTVLLVPLGMALMLFFMAWIEGEPTSGRDPHLPRTL